MTIGDEVAEKYKGRVAVSKAKVSQALYALKRAITIGILATEIE